jgi:hypothetical protein
MTVRIFPLFFVVTLCSGFSVDTFVTTVTAVKQHYRLSCVYLLYSQQTGEPRYVKIRVLISPKLSEFKFQNLE